MLRALAAAGLVIVAAVASAEPCGTPWTGDARGEVLVVAGGRVGLCASRTDTAGRALAAGRLRSCVVSARAGDAIEIATVEPAEPATRYSVQLGDALRGGGTVTAFCVGSDGQIGPARGPIPARFEPATIGPPEIE